MSLTIRLSKIGRKNRNAYRIVVARKRSHQSGRGIEILGYYDPQGKNSSTIDRERVNYWKKRGAVASNPVESILSSKYKPKIYKSTEVRPK